MSGTRGPILVAGLVVAFTMDLSCAEPPPRITRTALDGTNILITVSVTSGFERLVLESAAVTAGATWEPQGSIAVENGGGDFTFRLPRSAQTQLFRVRADAASTTAAAISSELSYVAAGSARVQGNAVVLRLRGHIDGTDRITITRDGAVWEHVSWGWPTNAVSLNDINWLPREKNIISTAGTSAFLPEDADLSGASLRVIRARDTVALEISTNAIVLHIADTPMGPDLYDLNVRIPRKQRVAVTASPGEPATLQVAARIDGSDQLRITASEAHWIHHQWSWPGEVRLNQVRWLPATNSLLANDGATRFLPSGVNFTTARIISRSGRDLITAETQPDGLILHFADNPIGAGDYAITVQFGP